MTLLSPVLSGVLNPALSGTSIAPEQRYFTRFRGINSHYISFPEIVLPTNTQWRILVEAAVSTQGAYLLADRTEGYAYSRYGVLTSTDGRVFGLTDDSSTTGGDTMGLLSDTQLRTYEAINTGGTIVHLIDGNQVHIVNDGTQAPVLNSVGRQYAGQTGVPPMEGVISRVLIEKLDVAVMDLVIDGNYTPTSNTVIDVSGNNNHGTFAGIEDGDSKLYTQNENGDWVSGEETLGGINN